MEIGKFELTGLCKDLDIISPNEYWWGEEYKKNILSESENRFAKSIHIGHIKTLSRVIEKHTDPTIIKRCARDICALTDELFEGKI